MQIPLSQTALPTYVVRAPYAHVGCSFLARAIDGGVWAVTVGHMGCWGPVRPSLSIEDWSDTLSVRSGTHQHDVRLVTGGKLCCRLFLTEGGEPGGNANMGGNTEVADVMAVPFPLEWLQGHGLFAEVTVIEILSAEPPIHGPGPVVAFGYTDPDETKKWPGDAPEKRAGELYDIQNNRYMAKMDTDEGMCGGPVFADDGSFVGMVNGSDVETHTQCRIVPDFVIWALVNDRPIGGLQAPAGYENAPLACNRGIKRFLPMGRIIGDGRPLR